jgi:hypothetical protein
MVVPHDSLSEAAFRKLLLYLAGLDSDSAAHQQIEMQNLALPTTGHLRDKKIP